MHSVFPAVKFSVFLSWILLLRNNRLMGSTGGDEELHHLLMASSSFIDYLMFMFSLGVAVFGGSVSWEASSVPPSPSGRRQRCDICDYSIFRDVCPYFFCRYLTYALESIPFLSMVFSIQALILHGVLSY